MTDYNDHEAELLHAAAVQMRGTELDRSDRDGDSTIDGIQDDHRFETRKGHHLAMRSTRRRKQSEGPKIGRHRTRHPRQVLRGAVAETRPWSG